ncbi:MAG: Undecaprenol kinase [Parcubacteria group bacterium GW2011_GWC2_39_14]|nr:MAG: Undecaprenol kinase [Parcubacteria group bacterium GW2011_GWC2_39_14]KKR54916.1 MAG: Undecaprenol kinase [Parcubacteria group bacterium GW2011_GWA2_40_23]
MLKIMRLFKSFKHAFAGLASLIRTEQNFKIHLLAALFVAFFGFYFQIKAWQWTIIVLMIALIFILEMLNTVFERLVDLFKPRLHPYVGEIKDIMSGMVLVASVAALILGLIIFLPYLQLNS